jgi:uncharacterized protein YjbI with pentapeptide repeats
MIDGPDPDRAFMARLIREEQQARDAEAERIRKHRDTPPFGYTPPIYVGDLRRRYLEGERYFGGAQLARASLAGENLSGVNLSNAALGGADLTGADLSGSQLDGADFVEANLTRAVLVGASLGMARFENALFDGVILKHAQVRGAVLRFVKSPEKIDWRGADLSQADLSQMFLRGARLDGVIAERARFVGCDCHGAAFHGAHLVEASFVNAALTDADFEGATIKDADLEGADLRDVKNLEFDRNRILNARLAPKSSDTWSVLRRSYTGTRFAFHLLILVVFLLPYVMRAALWIEVNRTQLLTEPARLWLTQQLHDRAPALDQRPLVASLGTRCLHPECRSWRVWELLIGRDQPWYSLALAILLLLYNAARVYLTWRVGPLREDEERTNVTPALSDYDKLKWAHRFFSVVLLLAVASLGMHLYHWLSLPVELPVG